MLPLKLSEPQMMHAILKCLCVSACICTLPRNWHRVDVGRAEVIRKYSDCAGDCWEAYRTEQDQPLYQIQIKQDVARSITYQFLSLVQPMLHVRNSNGSHGSEKCVCVTPCNAEVQGKACRIPPRDARRT